MAQEALAGTGAGDRQDEVYHHSRVAALGIKTREWETWPWEGVMAVSPQESLRPIACGILQVVCGDTMKVGQT